MSTFTCPRCGSENVRYSAKVFIDAPARTWHNLTKADYRSREVKLMGTVWDQALVYCADCGYVLYTGERRTLEYRGKK